MDARVHMFKSKIHRATVTHADLEYEGSVSIDADLMDAARIREHEQVHVWNVTQGTRLVTYAIRAPAATGVVCLNGAAAHLAHPGDKVILATFAEVSQADAEQWQPKVVCVNDANQIVSRDYVESAGPATGL